jgi:hypothetical protein
MSDPQTFKPTKRSIEVFNRLFKDVSEHGLERFCHESNCASGAGGPQS